MKNKELELAFDTFIESIKNDIEEKELTKEEVLRLKTGTSYIKIRTPDICKAPFQETLAVWNMAIGKKKKKIGSLKRQRKLTSL